MDWKTLLCEKRQREHTSVGNSSDPRNEFQKDYHRIIGSASFRRLQDKTQVFPLDKSDFVRTRLTHSFEVSSFAKSLGQMIFQNIIIHRKCEDIDEEVKDKICNVLECAGLIHDIGNPPFGHFGEDSIRDWFTRNLNKLEFKGQKIDKVLTEQMLGDFYHFEGNAQAVRLLTKLHFLIDKNGMNLNYTLLNAIIKYPVSSVQINKNSGDIKDKKIGYYYAEEEIFNSVTNSTGAIGCRHPLAFILEAADDIAYKTADIEDAVKKGFISYQQLLFELKNVYTNKCVDDGERSEYNRAVEKLELYYNNAIENKVSYPEQNAVQRWIIYVQGVLLRCASFGFTSNYNAIMNGSFTKEIISVSYGNAIAYALSDISFKYVFQSKQIYKLEIAAGTIIEYLLDKFINAVIKYDTDEKLSSLDKRLIALISDNYIQAYKIHSAEKDESEKLYLRLLLVTDFICGMTDSYAKRLYQELNGII